jgi:NAD(P)-dependent dehydrogenase (short-subunit alcohol dehydrogenase family)
VTAIEGDVASLSELSRVYAALRSQGRKIEVVFANARISQLAPLADVNENFADLHFDANVKGLFFTAKRRSHS